MGLNTENIEDIHTMLVYWSLYIEAEFSISPWDDVDFAETARRYGYDENNLYTDREHLL